MTAVFVLLLVMITLALASQRLRGHTYPMLCLAIVAYMCYAYFHG